MSKNVGLIYGKPRVRKLSIIAGSVIQSVSLTYSTKIAHNSISVSQEVPPFERVQISADTPESTTSSIRSYFNGDEPSEGNYYYNEVTNYKFDKWVDKNGSTISTSVRYEFQMPVEDTSITSIGSIYYTEANIVDSIKIFIENADQFNVSSITLNNIEHDDSFYEWIWPGVELSISASENESTVDSTTYHYGTNDNMNMVADAGNTRWYMRTYHDIEKIEGTDGSIIEGNTGKITPVNYETYRVYGSSRTSKTSISNAQYVTSTESGITSYASSTYKTSGSSQKWFWDNSTETINTTIYTSSSSWMTSSEIAYVTFGTSATNNNVTSNRSSVSTVQSATKSTTQFNGASQSWIVATTEYITRKQTWTSSAQNGMQYSTSVFSSGYSHNSAGITNASNPVLVHYTYKTLGTYNLTSNEPQVGRYESYRAGTFSYTISSKTYKAWVSSSTAWIAKDAIMSYTMIPNVGIDNYNNGAYGHWFDVTLPQVTFTSKASASFSVNGGSGSVIYRILSPNCNLVTQKSASSFSTKNNSAFVAVRWNYSSCSGTKAQLPSIHQAFSGTFYKSNNSFYWTTGYVNRTYGTATYLVASKSG